MLELDKYESAVGDTPRCSACDYPMEETSSQNPQITLPDGRRFDCQAPSQSRCRQWAPDGVGSVTALPLAWVMDNHRPSKK